MAVLRPVIEHGSCVWQLRPSGVSNNEQVQTRVLRRLAGLQCQVPDDVLRMEFGCRSYASWMDQRKLEYAFRLGVMQADRLPRRVAEAAWPATSGPKHARLHEGLVQAIAVAAGVDVHSCVSDGMTFTRFKRCAAQAVRKQDMVVIKRLKRTTVSRYLRIAGNPSMFPVRLQAYLSGPMSSAHAALLVCRADMLHTARRMYQKGALASAVCPHCQSGAEETLEHALLVCPAYEHLTGGMWEAVAARVGDAAVGTARAKPAGQQLEALLGGDQWGGDSLGVQWAFGSYVADLLSARSRTVGAGTLRGAGVADHDGDVRADGVGAGDTAQTLEQPDTACQCCQGRHSNRANQMLLCDGCERGYHQYCLSPPLTKVPAGDWLCPGCQVQVAFGACRPLPAGTSGPTAEVCQVCRDSCDAACMLLCDTCDCGFHWYCVGERYDRAPVGAWHCPGCGLGCTTSASSGARAHGARATAGA